MAKVPPQDTPKKSLGAQGTGCPGHQKSLVLALSMTLHMVEVHGACDGKQGRVRGIPERACIHFSLTCQLLASCFSNPPIMFPLNGSCKPKEMSKWWVYLEVMNLLCGFYSCMEPTCKGYLKGTFLFYGFCKMFFYSAALLQALGAMWY